MTVLSQLGRKRNDTVFVFGPWQFCSLNFELFKVPVRLKTNFTRAINVASCAAKRPTLRKKITRKRGEGRNAPLFKYFCNTTVSLAFRCNCLAGYTGQLCELNINDCSSLPCGSNADCIDGANFFQCACHYGFTGQYCNVRVLGCSSGPCQNNAECVVSR